MFISLNLDYENQTIINLNQIMSIESFGGRSCPRYVVNMTSGDSFDINKMQYEGIRARLTDDGNLEVV